ncbi:hypothetical protein RFN28_30950 [Mesorhizobium sp. VK24D]|uniref:Uncharacterized protein n=1 Tax=Mesorhizobium album TaxID=3072314 RepID=A0ABU4Y7E9_9HYPH|nr:hypothetical protein [Mesorhizobium sp. VK24D]MDX8482845.1 hypothetical protein [Mesorhizobium sp. VK24D]
MFNKFQTAAENGSGLAAVEPGAKIYPGPGLLICRSANNSQKVQ